MRHMSMVLYLCVHAVTTSEVSNVGHFKPVSLGLKCLSGTD